MNTNQIAFCLSEIHLNLLTLLGNTTKSPYFSSKRNNIQEKFLTETSLRWKLNDMIKYFLAKKNESCRKMFCHVIHFIYYNYLLRRVFYIWWHLTRKSFALLLMSKYCLGRVSLVVSWCELLWNDNHNNRLINERKVGM